MTYIVTSEYDLSQVAAPNLPLATQEYSQQYQDQLNNVLRLYFNRLDKILGQLKTGATAIDGAGLVLPTGAFYQDGVTTLTNSITNVSTADIVVGDTSAFALSAGAIIIGTELIQYTGKTPTSFTGITRGVYGSSKSAHTAGDTVSEAQPVPSSTAAAAIPLSQTTTSNNVSIDTTDLTKVVFATAGVYNIQFSVQLLTFDSTIDNAKFWFRQNGVDVPYSAGVATVPAIHGGSPGATIVSWNLVLPVAAGDYVQLLFASETGNTVCATYPAGTSPVHPASPSIILTATFVSGLY